MTTATKTVSQRVDEQTSHLLYKGKVHLDFDPVKHVYKINGEYVNGVTTALSIKAKPQLIYWSAKMASEYVKEHLRPGEALDEIQIQELIAGAKTAHLKKRDGAADMGTYIHNWIEDFVTGKDPEMPVSPKLKKTIEDFKKWWASEDIEVLHAERMLCSPTLMLAGTPDLICRVNGKLTIMDWKTGSGIYPDMFMQMAAYAIMLEEEYPEHKVESLHVVNASIKNMFQEEARSEVDQFKDAYLAALNLYKVDKSIQELFRKGDKKW